MPLFPCKCICDFDHVKIHSYVMRHHTFKYQTQSEESKEVDSFRRGFLRLPMLSFIGGGTISRIWVSVFLHLYTVFFKAPTLAALCAGASFHFPVSDYIIQLTPALYLLISLKRHSFTSQRQP